jgi:hypothetical protein
MTLPNRVPPGLHHICTTRSRKTWSGASAHLSRGEVAHHRRPPNACVGCAPSAVVRATAGLSPGRGRRQETSNSLPSGSAKSVQLPSAPSWTLRRWRDGGPDHGRALIRHHPGRQTVRVWVVRLAGWTFTVVGATASDAAHRWQPGSATRPLPNKIRPSRAGKWRLLLPTRPP